MKRFQDPLGDSIKDICIDELVTYSSRLQLPVCKTCKHAIWPNQVAHHFRRPEHEFRPQLARYVQRKVQDWSWPLRYPKDGVPSLEHALPAAVPELCLFDDGVKCLMDEKQCQYVCRLESSLKSHFAKEHPGQRGKRGARCMSERSKAPSTPWRTVYCQRIFPSRVGSQYFEVEPPPNTREAAPPVRSPPAATKIEQAREMLISRSQKIEDRERRIIEEGSAQEPNPWLDRTKWATYLRKLDRDDLLGSIATPDREEDPEAYIIWEAMMVLMRHCQRTVDEYAGVFVRKEVMRTEEEQSRFVPLKGYQSADEIHDKGRHWQQLLMFFVRTQRPHEWKSPRYRLTRRQREAFERLMDLVQEEVQTRPPPPLGRQREGRRSSAPHEADTTHHTIETDHDEDDVLDEAHWDDQQSDHTVVPWDNRSFEFTTGISRALLEFCIALICQKARQHEYENSLVCGLAVLGVDPQGWKGVYLYPPILSSVIKIARFMMVQHAFDETVVPEEHVDDGEGDHLDGDGSDLFFRSEHGEEVDDEHYRGGCIEKIAEIVDQYVLRKSHSPMEWMLDLRAYGMKIQLSGTAPGHVQWAGDQLLYKSIQFTMSQFRWMVHQLVHDCRERLLRKVLDIGSHQEHELPTIPWDQLRDDPANAQPGWSFIDDRRNPWPVDGEWWLFERLTRSSQYQFLQDGDEARWNVSEVQRWLEEIDQVDEDALVLKQLTSGAAARAPEVLSIRPSNTPSGGYRNMGIENGLLSSVVRYHKGYSMTGDVKIIHRYLPREVGDIFVYLLWLVQRLRQRVEADIYHRESRSSFMWPKWRPGGRGFTSDRLRDALKRVSNQYLGTELNIASTRHAMIAISRRYLRRAHRFEHDDEDERGEVNEDSDNIIDEQSGHIASIAWAIYARGIDERNGEMANKREQFRQASVSWHRWLGFGSTWQDGMKVTKKAPFEQENEETRFARWRQLRAVNIDLALEKLMGTGCHFRGIQRPAIQAVMQGVPRILGIMGTGGGKTHIFTLPAWCGIGKGGLTVVVVPLIALRRDMVRRCREWGLECVEWGGSRCPDGADIVLATPEATFTAMFHKFMARMKANQRLDRIVVDEAHVALNRQRNFRRKLQQLGELNRYDVQMIMLTATLPVQLEDEFRRRMGIDQAGVSIFRDATTRKNVAYRIHQLRPATRSKVPTQRQQMDSKKRRLPVTAVGIPDDGSELSVKALFIQKHLQHGRSGKVVVYCSTVAETKSLAELLGCDAYHHHAKDKDEKMRAFQSGSQSVMICTSAFGMGVDISDIRVIIHMGAPRSLLEYAQESGRAGRDGQGSEAIIVLPAGSTRQTELLRSRQFEKGQEQSDDVAQRLVWDFIEASCQREVLDRYMDGNTTREGCGSDEQACYGCLRHRAHSELSSTRMACVPGLEKEQEDDGVMAESREEEESTASDDNDDRGTSSSCEEDKDDDDDQDEDDSSSGSDDSHHPTAQAFIVGHKRSADAAWLDQNTFRQQQSQQQQIGRDWAQQHQDSRRMMESLKSCLERLQGQCVCCVYLFGCSNGHSSVFRCHQASVRHIRDVYNQLKGAIRRGREMARFAGCSFCFVPQAWCQRWELRKSTLGGGYHMARDRQGQTRRCQFEDVVLSIIATGLVLTGYSSSNSTSSRQSVSFLEGMQGRMSLEGRDWQDSGELVRYLSQAVVSGGLETSRLMSECWQAWQHLQRIQTSKGPSGRVEQIDENTLVLLGAAIGAV